MRWASLLAIVLLLLWFCKTSLGSGATPPLHGILTVGPCKPHHLPPSDINYIGNCTAYNEFLLSTGCNLTISQSKGSGEGMRLPLQHLLTVPIHDINAPVRLCISCLTYSSCKDLSCSALGKAKVPYCMLGQLLLEPASLVPAPPALSSPPSPLLSSSAVHTSDTHRNSVGVTVNQHITRSEDSVLLMIMVAAFACIMAVRLHFLNTVKPQVGGTRSAPNERRGAEGGSGSTGDAGRNIARHNNASPTIRNTVSVNITLHPPTHAPVSHVNSGFLSVGAPVPCNPLPEPQPVLKKESQQEVYAPILSPIRLTSGVAPKPSFAIQQEDDPKNGDDPNTQARALPSPGCENHSDNDDEVSQQPLFPTTISNAFLSLAGSKSMIVDASKQVFYGAANPMFTHKPSTAPKELCLVPMTSDDTPLNDERLTYLNWKSIDGRRQRARKRGKDVFGTMGHKIGNSSIPHAGTAGIDKATRLARAATVAFGKSIMRELRANESSTQPVKVAEDQENAVSRFRKMLAVGVPRPAVEAKMKAEGFAASLLDDPLPNLPEASSQCMTAAIPPDMQGWNERAVDLGLAPYEKMMRLGIPVPAVIQKMQKDGCSPAELASFTKQFSQEVRPSALPTSPRPNAPMHGKPHPPPAQALSLGQLAKVAVGGHKDPKAIQLDHKRALQTGIALAKLRYSPECIVVALATLDPQIQVDAGGAKGVASPSCPRQLDIHQIELLDSVLSPQAEEVTSFKEFIASGGDVSKLGQVERFLAHLAQVPDLKVRVAILGCRVRLPAQLIRATEHAGALCNWSELLRTGILPDLVLAIKRKANLLQPTRDAQDVASLVLLIESAMKSRHTLPPSGSVATLLLQECIDQRAAWQKAIGDWGRAKGTELNLDAALQDAPLLKKDMAMLEQGYRLVARDDHGALELYEAFVEEYKPKLKSVLHHTEECISRYTESLKLLGEPPQVRPDSLRRSLAALLRAVQTMLDKPEDVAKVGIERPAPPARSSAQRLPSSAAPDWRAALQAKLAARASLAEKSS